MNITVRRTDLRITEAFNERLFAVLAVLSICATPLTDETVSAATTTNEISFVQDDATGIRGDIVAIAEAEAMVESMGGKAIWSSFGPEGGLLSLVAFALGTVALWLWIRRRTGGLRLRVSLAEAPSLSAGSSNPA